MKLLIAASLLAIAFVPAAAANHDVCPSSAACVSTYSASNGDCNTNSGYEYSYSSVSAYSYGTPAGYAGVGAAVQCFDYQWGSYGYSGSYVGAGACASNMGYTCAGTYWYGYSGSFNYCAQYVYAYGSGLPYMWQNLGCPVGAPPGVPAALP